MMRDKQEIIIITMDELKKSVQECADQKYRISQINATTLRDGTYEINYSFEKEYDYKTYRISLPSTETEIPSMSGIYLPAFLYENELHDLFGFKFSGVAINYDGKFYKLSRPQPFKTRE